MSSRFPTAPPVLVLLAALALAACSGKTPQARAGLTPIRFATDWRAEAEQGGFYEALAEGRYAKRGLAVRIIPGGPGVNVPELIGSGAVDMGIGSNSFIVMNLAARKIPIKAVAAFMQKDPQVLIAHPDVGINSLADIKGHPVLLSSASVNAFWVWLKAKYGFTDSQVHAYTSSAPFIANKDVVEEGYLTNEPYTIQKKAHFSPKVFLLADYGYSGYAAMVLAPDKLIASDPKAVRAFVQASAVGWKDYLFGDPRPADALILADNQEMTEDVLAQARQKMRQAGIVDSGDAAKGGLGVMTDARWKSFFDMASKAGVYPADLDWKSAYTLAFVGKPGT
ncbi:MAG: ABC transporter substrate-binding protein [Caulobacteraceae bacterium]